MNLRPLLVCALAVTLVRPALVLAADGEASKARAAALVKEGNRAFDAGDYTAALSKFQSAFGLYASPRILFNLGQCYDRLGRYDEATESFEGFLARAASAPAPARAEAQRALEELHSKVARVEVVGPRSPLLSAHSFQMVTLFSCSQRTFVSPRRNHSSS